MFTNIVSNIGGRVRRERLHGREHLVAPLTLIVPGVLNGSCGPMLYPRDELNRNPEDWNHIPIVVYHPQLYGTAVTARDPAILNSHGIGYLFNVRSNGRLTAEGWFDIKRMRKVDTRVLQALQRSEPMEVSTGLFLDRVPSSGVLNGKHYDFVAHNYHPDHLAVLPDEVAACSLADGCGVLADPVLTNADVERLNRFLEWELKQYETGPVLSGHPADMLISPQINWHDEGRQQCNCQSNVRASYADDILLPPNM